MTQKRIDYINFEEFKKLYSSTKDRELKLAMELGFGSGLRISEIIGHKRKDGTEIPRLKSSMIDLASHQIRIDDAKGKKWRTTIISPSLTEAKIKILPLKIPRRTLQDKFQKLAVKVIGKKFSFHTLRHGFGNYQANVLKVPLPIVQQMMGHSRLDTTGIYTKANPEHSIQVAWAAVGGK